ncbi:MAG: hypothetical protein KQH79_05915 [Bacteroidetes bacterium]|nr:hypothetical protein [Bacteroidota bacterium]
MKIKLISLLVFIGIISCHNQKEKERQYAKNKCQNEIKFDQQKWQTKEGKDYPYRDRMVNDIVYNDTIRTLTRDEVLELLGQPSYYREDTNYLYYMIRQKRLFSWPLHTKTLVVKMKDENTIEWIRIHE